MSKQSSLHRVLEILNRLNSGEKLCVSRLLDEYEVSERTIQRDFKMIIEVFGNFLDKERECYHGKEKFLLQNLLGASDLLMLAHILHLFNLANKTFFINTKIQTAIKDAEEIYMFKAKELETIKNVSIVNQIEHAIKYKKQLMIEYSGRKKESVIILQPYRIVLLNQNFYLLGENYKTKQVNKLRISLIKKVKITSKNFKHNIQINNFITNIQTPWSEYNSKNIIIKIKVHKKLAKYFKLKQYLPSQNIIRTLDNKEIEVEYRVSSLREIEGLIIKWLPDITIIEPQELKNKVREKLLYKLDGLS